MLNIDVRIEDASWNECKPLFSLMNEAALKTLEYVNVFLNSGELSVLLTDDSSIRSLNLKWRHLDKATNVLSFPATTFSLDKSFTLLGDMVFAYQTISVEAETQKKNFYHHFLHLFVHGLLHILGYDHQTETEAETMECIEKNILKLLDISDPYALF